jgi:hypothetical protein
MREIAFHTLFCMVSMVSILLTMQKKYTSENDPLQAPITMREFQFFESIIEKILIICVSRVLLWILESKASKVLKMFTKCCAMCYFV